MAEKKKINKKLIAGIAILAVLVAAFAIIFSVFRAKPVEGSKAITIEVVDKEQKSTVYDVKTDAEYLRQAMEEAEGLEFSGTESEYGLMVDTVNGLTADFSVDGSYWGFFVNGKYCDYGIDSQHFRLFIQSALLSKQRRLVEFPNAKKKQIDKYYIGYYLNRADGCCH